MVTSNSYLFGANTQLDDLFREAYERIGVLGNDQTPLNIQSAYMSANLELSSWPGKGLNLWLVKRKMFDIVPNQPNYPLPLETVRVLEVVATAPVRLNTGGTAISNQGGNAANCFNNTLAGCVQNAPNGSIIYDYGDGNAQSVLYVGIKPLGVSFYTINIDYSFDGVNFIQAYNVPRQEYLNPQITWFVIEQSVSARYWAIHEIGGSTLEISQIYFSQPNKQGVGDRMLSALSRSEYMSIATKMNTGYPSGYYFDQLVKPTMMLWPVPQVGQASTTPTNILYTNYGYASDVTQMFQNADVPQRFYDALVCGIAARLALKFAPDKFPTLKQEAQEAYQTAAATDFENVTIRFEPDFTGYSG